MITKRLELALERLSTGDWERFEKLASAFLAAEFSDLRTTASPSGDGGRDSEIFSPKSEPSIALQYSVTANWEDKIRKTVERLKETLPGVNVLIYVSSRVIGASSDPIKIELRKQGIALDVRDRNWFVERVAGSAAREHAAEELSQLIVDPYLSSRGVSAYSPAELSSPEVVAAVTFLGLQWQDEIRDKGLTKLTFEGLVRGALANTSSDKRMSRAAVHSAIASLLPDHPAAEIAPYIEQALRKLEKKAIRHFTKEDEYCLTHEESQRASAYKATAALADLGLLDAIRSIVGRYLSSNKKAAVHIEALSVCVRAAVDAVLFERSQAFAASVKSGDMTALAQDDFRPILLAEFAKTNIPKMHGVDWVELLQDCIREVLTSSNSAVSTYMRALADSYTLLAFLKLTPDVQGAVEKMFSHGKLWLDATVLLPLIAETLRDEGQGEGRFTRMMDAAREAGLELFATPGVIEEVERHMNRALTCARLRPGDWQGSVPYLLDRYVATGRSTMSFASWLENFRGDARPLDDLADYLRDVFGVRRRSLEVERDASPQELRAALEQIWHEKHKRRRDRPGADFDEAIMTRLVNHDVECYCGVTHLRTQEKASPFGYSAWWLTMDSQAFDLKEQLKQRMHGVPPDSPVMSADFMVNYLAFGPVRPRVGKGKEAHLPLLMVVRETRDLTPDLLAQAEIIRDSLRGLPDHVVRRKMRDHLDQARRRIGPIAKAGLAMDEELALKQTTPAA